MEVVTTKSKEVLELLQITRSTLTKYVKEGIIKIEVLPNGGYDYDKESVYKLFNKGVDRKIELLDNYWFGIKMINRGEATYEELKPQFDEIEKELNFLGYYKKAKRKWVKKE